MSEQQMTVTFPGGKRVDALYDAFHIETDQSPRFGGDGSAPEPFDLFLASLATCAGIYVLGFCERRDLPTDGLRLVQRWFRDAKGRLETIALDIQLPDGFPEKYRAAVIRAAQQCTVKKTMENPPRFEVRAVPAGDEPAAGRGGSRPEESLPTLPPH